VKSGSVVLKEVPMKRRKANGRPMSSGSGGTSVLLVRVRVEATDGGDDGVSEWMRAKARMAGGAKCKKKTRESAIY